MGGAAPHNHLGYNGKRPAVEGCAVSTMALDDPLKDLITEYEQPLELSGTGEIRDGAVHIHVVLGSEGNQTISGHLHWARVNTFFVRAYCMALWKPTVLEDS